MQKEEISLTADELDFETNTKNDATKNLDEQTKKATKTKSNSTKKTENTKVFFKEQFVKSKEYLRKRDLINALLESDKTYSKTEVETIIKNYLEGEI